ncbi:PREDICTED: disease resistance protein RGA2-like isoform X2 [Nelumbo nucifera]|uniref:Disease resistance protein RGA2-like isoform X2 n=1 Tax=Nelumbo nucifera TaxID=4432 RepID=A0A1U8Q9Y1_NELNU|nr:PREDICTED: disease resistance protein RGA2-like isoform X2 [Nelumbo nucifera]
MADGLVSVFLGKLVSIIQQDIQKEIRLVTGVREDVEKLSSTLRSIQAVLKDAEEKQVKDNLVKVWLENLKDIAYDTDDVLDEWSTKIFMLKEVRPTNNLLSCCFWFKQVGLHRDIGLKIKKINKRLDEITSVKDKFNFKSSRNVNNNNTWEEPINRPEIRQTSSLIDVSVTVGRNSEKELIVSKLLSEDSRQDTTFSVPIISISGMGGLGKTTLAQLVFNDDKVIAHFEKKIWVCVSEPFDKVRIAKEIVKAIDDGTINKNDIPWDSLHNLLSKSLENRHYLLVLDDMWTENVFDWEPLKLSLNGGAQGSRILVTTRNRRVATMLGTAYLHNLELLSDEDCWSLMRGIAFAERTTEERQMLEGIGMEIAKKCKGLPLSAKSIGGLLRFKRPTKQHWQDVLESHIWEDVQENILPGILLSYNDLPSHLKQCFAYCAIFRKDESIYKDDLVKLWMAQGFLVNNSSSERMMEMVGEEYFDILVMRSFFQVIAFRYKKVVLCKIHDLVHDFAQLLTEKECYAFDISNEIMQDSKYNNARHLTLTRNDYDDGLSEKTIPNFIYEAKKLKTLRLPPGACGFSGIFQKLTCLRALNLKRTHLEEVPSKIEMLIHLRFLNLSGTKLKELPGTLSNLHNLQVLNLRYCSELCKLPEGIGKLTKMRHLDIKGTHKLQYLPQGIGRLSSLCTLSKFIIGGDGAIGEGGCTIKELQELKFLQGELEIRGLGRLKSENEADDVDLKNKENIHSLGLCFDGSDDGQEDSVEEKMEKVMEGLQPHLGLKKLKIEGYLGTELASWMVRDDGLPYLHHLELCRCKNLNKLPPAVGKLPFLRFLSISGMEEIKYMDHSFFGMDSADAVQSEDEAKKLFPELRFLEIENMENLEEWDLGTKEIDGRETTSIILMPRLLCLSLENCPKLKVLPHRIFPTVALEALTISDCPQLTWTPSSLCFLRNLHSLNLIYDAGNFTALRKLHLNTCEFIDSIPDELQHLTTLKRLEISYRPLLKERCIKQGADWNKICHIPHIEINRRRIQ